MKRTFKLLLLVTVACMGFVGCGDTIYTIEAKANRDYMGVVTGGGKYVAGAQVELAAWPESGYYFIRWNDGYRSDKRTVTAGSDITYWALFSDDRYDSNPYDPSAMFTLSVTSNNTSWGMVTGGGRYAMGESVTISATPNAGYSFEQWDDGSRANPRHVTVTGDATYKAIFAQSSNPDPQPTTGAWVDLGLPSGLLWATCNVGASVPEEYGDYYAWGETATKSNYNWSTYKYCNNGYSDRLTKYCNNSNYGYNGFTDNLTTLQASDDVATARLGNGARIPTREEWDELINNTTSEWTTQNGKYGRRLISKTNGRSLFLPAAGYRYGSEFSSVGSYGYYWSSSLDAGDPNLVWRFYFYSGGQYMGSYYRYYGQSIRAVRQN